MERDRSLVLRQPDASNPESRKSSRSPCSGSPFGSLLRNEARPDSYADVLLQFNPALQNLDGLMALADLLEETLERRVELVTTEGAFALHRSSHPG